MSKLWVMSNTNSALRDTLPPSPAAKTLPAPAPTGPTQAMVGQHYGWLTVLSVAQPRDRRGRVECRCRCGVTRDFDAYKVRTGETISCGCGKRRHGESNTDKRRGSPEYYTWQAMKARCFLQTHIHYANYGGRGITVCDRWMAYENFLEDMGRRPGPKWSLDRIDNDGNYEPGNCRWSDDVEQNNNKRTNLRVTLRGVTHSVAEWSRLTGIKYTTLLRRLEAGWHPADAIDRPVAPHLMAAERCEFCSGQGERYVFDGEHDPGRMVPCTCSEQP